MRKQACDGDDGTTRPGWVSTMRRACLGRHFGGVLDTVANDDEGGAGDSVNNQWRSMKLRGDERAVGEKVSMRHTRKHIASLRYHVCTIPRAALASCSRRDTRTQLSMRASKRSPKSWRSCALGSISPREEEADPALVFALFVPGMTSRGRIGFDWPKGPRESLKDCLRRAQRELGSSSFFRSAVSAVRRGMRTAPTDEGREGVFEMSSESSCFTVGLEDEDEDAR